MTSVNGIGTENGNDGIDAEEDIGTDDSSVGYATLDDDDHRIDDVQAKGNTQPDDTDSGYYYRLSDNDVLYVWGGSGSDEVELNRKGGGDGTFNDDGSVSYELKDGSTISIAEDNTISWQNRDGTSGSDTSAVGTGGGNTEERDLDGGNVDFGFDNGSTQTQTETQTETRTETRTETGATDHVRYKAPADDTATAPTPVASGTEGNGEHYAEFEDGSRFERDADGDARITDAEGNLLLVDGETGDSVAIETDGDVTVTDARGNMTRIDAGNGEVVTGRTFHDGSIHWTNDDGDEGLLGPDGSAVRIDADGDRFVRDAQGNVVWETAEGQSGTRTADGASHYYDATTGAFGGDGGGGGTDLRFVPELSDPEFFEGVSERAASEGR